MNINTIQMIANQALSAEQPVADPQQISQFTQLMQEPALADLMATPEALLVNQAQWINTTLAIDLTAKVTGVVGQGINKLVHMQ